MEHLQHAKRLYRKRHDHANVLTPDDHATLSVSITKMIRTCLIQLGGVASFKYVPFIQVIKKTVASGRFQSDRAAMAFATLEKYLLLLVEQPWKREYWLLKTYGGYFCTKVKAHLENPETILELVGYAKEDGSRDDSRLVLDHPPDTDIVLNVAFDCQVAAVECLCIGEYYEKMKCIGLNLSDAVNVMLSGAPNDPVLGSPVVVLQGKNMQMGNNHYVNIKPDLSKKNMGSVGPHPSSPQMVMASGGMGMGVVTETNAAHQVTGLHPRLMGSHHSPPTNPIPAPAQQPYTNVPDHHMAGLKVELPMPQHHFGVGEAVGRPPSIASQPPGSRASYGCAQSSGYGSGVASVLSAPLSANTASSGYSSGAPSQTPAHNYPYHPEGRIGDHVDAPLMTAPSQHTVVSHRHHRQHPLPQQLTANFPFMDEEEIGSSSPFPEGTQEEHLRESLRNLQGTQEDKNRGKSSSVVSSSSQIFGHRDGVSGREGVPVPYDDWRWFRRGQGAEPPPAYNTIFSTGSNRVHQSSTMIQRPVHHTGDLLRSTNSQPATAVTAMLTPDPMMTNADTKRHISPLDGRHQRVQSVDYPPLVGNMSTAGSLSGTEAVHNRLITSSNTVLNNAGDGRIGASQQTVYYPPPPEDVPFQRYATSVAGPPLQQRQAPTFAQVAPARRQMNNSALLSRQAQVCGTSVLNNLDKDHPGKALNIGSKGSRSSSEVIMRDKVLGKLGNMRSSSLVSPHTTDAERVAGFCRQSSRSMDMGMLKWKCQTCTMENSAMDTICTACSKSRDAPDMQFPAAGESKLMCPSCTFENPTSHKECEVCGNALPQDVHTYV